MKETRPCPRFSSSSFLFLITETVNQKSHDFKKTKNLNTSIPPKSERDALNRRKAQQYRQCQCHGEETEKDGSSNLEDIRILRWSTKQEIKLFKQMIKNQRRD